jgi:hypothetical protein
MRDWESHIDRAIREATESGSFDHLPGQGKRLDLRNNPLEDPATRLANQIMKDNDVLPGWLQDRKTIEADLELLRDEVKRMWQWYQKGGMTPANWQKRLESFRQRFAEINSRILTYNLKAPTLQVHMVQVNIDREIERVCQSA